MKKLVKKAVNQLGYELVKRDSSPVVKGDFWEDWFYKYPSELTDAYVFNRMQLSQVEDWLDEEIHRDSYWGYGVPDYLMNDRYKYNLNFNPFELTYTDLLCMLGRKMGEVKYLEIGVSAGKNFYQMYNSLGKSGLYGMDIESINPTIEKFLSGKSKTWEADEEVDFRNGKNEMVKKRYSKHEYNYPSSKNKVTYLSGDKFDSLLWEQLAGVQFNLIFSDAFHRPASIKDEYEKLKEYDLIHKADFIMAWDDMESVEMQLAFQQICEDMCKNVFPGRQASFKVYDLHGTYAGKHTIGLFWTA